MADTFGKRLREAKKRKKRELKAERKRLRKEGLLVSDSAGLVPDGAKPLETVDNPDAPEEEQQVPPPPPPA